MGCEIILNGEQATRRKQKKQPESGTAPRFCHLSCHARAEQSTAGGGFAGTCRSSNLHAERVKSKAAARFSSRHGAAKTAGRPLQPVPSRRVIAAADRLDDPAQQPRLLVPPQADKGRPVDGDIACRRDLQDLDRGGSEPLLAGRTAAIGGRRRRSIARAQPCPLEARIGVGRIVDPRHATGEQRRGEARPRKPRAAAAAAAPPATRPPPTCRQGHRARFAARRAWPRSRPDHRHGARPADGECRADGRPRAAADSAPRALLPAGRRAAWPRTSAGSRPRTPWRPSRDAVAAASAADSGRSAWSTISPTIRPPRAAAHSCASSARASESRPPDTATATTGAPSNGSNGAISRAKSAASRGRSSAVLTRSRSSGAPGRRGASAGRWRVGSPG